MQRRRELTRVERHGGREGWRRRKAGPGKGGEGKGTRRSGGSSRGEGAVVAAARERQEPHSNRPLAMTQQHAACPRSHGATTRRRRPAARRGLEGGETRELEGSREKRGRARRLARRVGVGARPLSPCRCAPAHCMRPLRAHQPLEAGSSPPGRRWSGNLVFQWPSF